MNQLSVKVGGKPAITRGPQGSPEVPFRDPVGETGGTRSAAASAGLLDLHGRLGRPPRGDEWMGDI